MFKRVMLSVLLVGFIGLLVWGGVVRTIAKSDQVLGVSAEGRGEGGEGLGRGQGEHGSSDHDKVEAAAHEGEDDPVCAADADQALREAKGEGRGDGNGTGEGQGDGQGNGEGLGDGDGFGLGDGSGQGDGQGEGNGTGQGQNSQFVEAPAGWETVTGTVVVAPGEDIDLVIETEDGELEIGSGPNWMASQGYLLEVGEEVTIVGYEQDGEFKAGTITRASDGESITLRDETGRPAWSGQGRRQSQ